MSEAIIPADSITVGPHLVNVIRHLAGDYTLYLDVGGAAYEVLTLGTAPHDIVVSDTPTRTCDLNWCIKVLPDYLKQGQKFCIYGVVPTPAATGELTAGEVGA